jgi:hypothetical protein
MPGDGSFGSFITVHRIPVQFLHRQAASAAIPHPLRHQQNGVARPLSTEKAQHHHPEDSGGRIEAVVKRAAIRQRVEQVIQVVE